MPVNRVLIVGALLLLSSYLLAQEVLSEQFLEYLGDYEEIDGEWIDPLEFAETLEKMSSSNPEADDKDTRQEATSEN